MIRCEFVIGTELNRNVEELYSALFAGRTRSEQPSAENRVRAYARTPVGTYFEVVIMQIWWCQREGILFLGCEYPCRVRVCLM